MNGCATTDCRPEAFYPIAGAAVADELEKMCAAAKGCPATEEWLGRLEKMADSMGLSAPESD